jgi:hypothetical protein
MCIKPSVELGSVATLGSIQVQRRYSVDMNVYKQNVGLKAGHHFSNLAHPIASTYRETWGSVEVTTKAHNHQAKLDAHQSAVELWDRLSHSEVMEEAEQMDDRLG